MTAPGGDFGVTARLRSSDALWAFPLACAGAVLIAVLLTRSVQGACAVALTALVLAVYVHDRSAGIGALFAFWFLAPFIRRLFDLYTGFLNTDPLSLAPFIATAAIAALQLTRTRLTPELRRLLVLAPAGFAFGLPLGAAHPSAALYAFGAYVAGVGGAIIGFAEPPSLHGSALRKVLLFGLVPIAAYGIVQHVIRLPVWDQRWLDATGVLSIGTSSNGSIRAFGTLNAPGALAPLLGLSLLCYLTVHRGRTPASIAFTLVAVALAVTFVRSAWIALGVAAVAHIVASRGHSLRPVLLVAGLAVGASLALAPVSSTARDVVNRFNTIGQPGSDTSATDRRATLGETLPTAVTAPLGHGLGTAGEPTKLTTDQTLRAPDNGYLSLMYQVGPVGFVLVMFCVLRMLLAAWEGARSRAPGQELRLLLFAMLVYLLVALASGDEFYGSLGVILWFIGGQALALRDHQRRPVATAST